MSGESVLKAAEANWKSAKALVDVAQEVLPPEEAADVRRDFRAKRRQSIDMIKQAEADTSTPVPAAGVSISEYLESLEAKDLTMPPGTPSPIAPTD